MNCHPARPAPWYDRPTTYPILVWSGVILSTVAASQRQHRRSCRGHLRIQLVWVEKRSQRRVQYLIAGALGSLVPSVFQQFANSFIPQLLTVGDIIRFFNYPVVDVFNDLHASPNDIQNCLEGGEATFEHLPKSHDFGLQLTPFQLL